MQMKDFGKWARRTGQNVSDNADRVVRKCALATDAAVVLATPVDTGRARSNWQVGVNSIPGGTVPPYAPGNRLGTGEGANARAAIAQGQSAVAAYKGGSPQAAIHIKNNLSYIGDLNAGTSAQAPAGFVEKAVLVGISAIQNEVLAVRKVQS